MNVLSAGLVIVTCVLLAACGKPRSKDRLSDAEVAYYSATVSATYRPLISFASRIGAVEWVHNGEPQNSEIDEQTAKSLIDNLAASAMTIRQLKTDGVSEETRALAEDIAARRAATSLSFRNVRRPDAAMEFLGWLIDSASLNDRHGNERERDEIRMKMGMQRLGGYASATAKASIQEAEATERFKQSESEILRLIETHRIALGGMKAIQLPSQDATGLRIISEQQARAEKVSKGINAALLDQTLRGSKVGTWIFAANEVKSVKILSTQIKGHCILQEAEIDVYAPIGGARKLKVRMAHEVFVDETIRLIAVR